MTVDPEAVDAHSMNDAFLRLMALRTHSEFPAGYEHHARGVAFPSRKTTVTGATSDLGLGAVAVFGAGRERPNHDTTKHDCKPERTDQNTTRYHWNAYVFWKDCELASTGMRRRG